MAEVVKVVVGQVTVRWVMVCSEGVGRVAEGLVVVAVVEAAMGVGEEGLVVSAAAAERVVVLQGGVRAPLGERLVGEAMEEVPKETVALGAAGWEVVAPERAGQRVAGRALEVEETAEGAGRATRAGEGSEGQRQAPMVDFVG